MNSLHIPVRGAGGATRGATSSAHTGAGLDKPRLADGSVGLQLRSTKLWLTPDYGLTDDPNAAWSFPAKHGAAAVGEVTLDGQWEILPL